MRWLIAAALVALLVAPAAAQRKTYKCGSQFQDRPCAGPAAPQPEKAPPPKPVSSAAAEEAKKQIRCENYGRQISELRNREKGEKNAQAVKVIASQRGMLETKMKGEGC